MAIQRHMWAVWPHSTSEDCRVRTYDPHPGLRNRCPPQPLPPAPPTRPVAPPGGPPHKPATRTPPPPRPATATATPRHRHAPHRPHSAAPPHEPATRAPPAMTSASGANVHAQQAPYAERADLSRMD